MLRIFESKERKAKDRHEINLLRKRYGASLLYELQQRANNKELNNRDRKHWQRLLRRLKFDNRKPNQLFGL